MYYVRLDRKYVFLKPSRGMDTSLGPVVLTATQVGVIYKRLPSNRHRLRLEVAHVRR